MTPGRVKVSGLRPPNSPGSNFRKRDLTLAGLRWGPLPSDSADRSQGFLVRPSAPRLLAVAQTKHSGPRLGSKSEFGEAAAWGVASAA